MYIQFFLNALNTNNEESCFKFLNFKLEYQVDENLSKKTNTL